MYDLRIIKKLRLARGLTQQQLGDLAGLERSYISRLETFNLERDRSPRLIVIEQIANALKVCPHSLIKYSCEQCPIFENCKKEKVDIDELIEEYIDFYI